MINVQIDETTLLNLFMNRLEYWTRENEVLALYEDKDLYLVRNY